MPRYLRPTFLLAALGSLAALAGCGGSGRDSRPRLTVFAAASLTEPLTTCSERFEDATVRLSFGGSDELAAQIRQGLKPDVYAAANTALPDALHREGRIERPVVFATNELVLAVPAQGARVHSLADLSKRGTTLAIGSAGVPIGAYTRQVLARRPDAHAILANVRSTEPDVKGIVGKLTQGAVDAGFVDRSDVEATDGRLKAIMLPAALRPKVAYGAAVVRGDPQPEPARRYRAGLRSGACAAALRSAGFGAPPACAPRRARSPAAGAARGFRRC
jgi:molybdate transport system substrate-binding protein